MYDHYVYLKGFPLWMIILFINYQRVYWKVFLTSYTVRTYNLFIYFATTAPAELNPLEHEVIPMTAQPHHGMQNSSPPVPQQTPGRHPDLFQLVSPLPLTFSVKQDNTFTLHRAVMDRQPVVLRVLKGTVR